MHNETPTEVEREQKCKSSVYVIVCLFEVQSCFLSNELLPGDELS